MAQFDKVSSTYGAPIGRREFQGPPAHKSVSVFRVRFVDGDYDDGGAYWGASMLSTMALYCARDTDGDYRQFVRAYSRKDAIESLNIPPEWLKRKA